MDFCCFLPHTVLGVQIHPTFPADACILFQRCEEITILVEVQQEHQPILFPFPSSFIDLQCVAELALKDVGDKGGTDGKREVRMDGHGMGHTQVCLEATKGNECGW